MNPNKLLQNIRLGWSPFVIIAVTTLAAIAISIYCLSSGWVIIFQNLFYVPIIIACVFYTKKGFAFSVVLSFIYLFLIIAFTRDSAVIIQALIRICIFSGVAGVTTFLSIKRKRAEEELRETNEYLENLFNYANTPIIVWDTQFRITRFNKTFEALTGRSAADVIGTSIEILFPPTLVDRSMELIGKTLRGERWEIVEINIQHLDGSVRTVLWNSATIFAVDGKTPVTTIAQGQDITLRKRVEEELRESEARYRILFDGINDAVFVHDLEEDGVSGRFLQVNEETCRRLGYTREELLSLTPRDITIPEEYERIADKRISLTSQRDILAETIHVTKDGRKIPVESNIRQFKYFDKQVALSISRDITERKRAEEEKAKLEGQLQQAQKMESVGRLAGGVAHDFNNMLGVILGCAEMAMEQIDPAQPLHAYLEEIHKAASRSTDITRQLLAFARKQTIAPKVLDLNETLKKMLKMLRQLIGEDINLSWKPGAALWSIKADPSQIDQILANLCINARDAISGVGKITIGTANSTFDEDYCALHAGFVPGEYVLLFMSDDGCGIDKETLSHLFEPFFTTKSIGKGAGLGLATVYGIIKQNNGFINVYSEPDQGTTFKIYLPRHVGKTEQHRTKGQMEPARRGHETILLVEDERAILTLSKFMLEKQGYRVLTAGTPGEAIRLAEEKAEEIHLLMTDVVMPEMNGRDLSNKMLSLYPNLKCLFMSGYTANVIAHHGVLDEGVHFIQKPFSREGLAAKVREALDRE